MKMVWSRIWVFRSTPLLEQECNSGSRDTWEKKNCADTIGDHANKAFNDRANKAFNDRTNKAWLLTGKDHNGGINACKSNQCWRLLEEKIDVPAYSAFSMDPQCFFLLFCLFPSIFGCFEIVHHFFSTYPPEQLQAIVVTRIIILSPAGVTNCTCKGHRLQISCGGFPRDFSSQILVPTSPLDFLRVCESISSNECQSPSWMWSLMNRWQSVLCFAGLISRRERNKSGIHSVPTFQTNLKKKRTCSLLLVLIQYLFFV